MDGNGRWAAARGLPVAEGHREGARALRRTVEAAIDLGIALARRVRVLDGELGASRRRGRVDHGAHGRDDRPRASRPRETGRSHALLRPPRPRAGRRCRRRWRARGRDGAERPAQPLDRVRLRRPRRARRGRAAARRGRSQGPGRLRGGHRRAALRARARPIPTSSSAPRASSGSRTSSSGSPPTRSSSSTRRSGPTSARSGSRAALDEYASRGRQVRRAMSVSSSRASLVAASSCRSSSASSTSAAGGSSALALVGGLIALHELYTMARELRPLVLGRLPGLRPGAARAPARRPRLDARRAPRDLRPLVRRLRPLGRPAVGDDVVRRDAARRRLGGRGLGLLLLVRDIPEHGFWAVMAVLFTVFAADTAAFFVGRAVGRHKMAPAISPGKTWEGFVGGVVAAMVGGVRRSSTRTATSS